MNSTRKILTTIFVILALLITAKAALGDLVLDEASVQVNGITFVPPGPVNIFPGDSVTMRFNFQNNDTNEAITFIETSADPSVAAVSPNLPYQNQCVGVDCTTGQWVLTPSRNSGSHQFTFTVPYEVSPAITTFNLVLSIASRDIPGVDDTYTIPFNINRPTNDIEIVDNTVRLTPSELSCSSQTELRYDIVNTGRNSIPTEDLGVLVYDKAAVESSMSTRTGKFSQFSSTPVITVEQNLNQILPGVASIGPGQRVTIRMQINTSALGTGSHRLYTYLVNPHFREGDNFIGDKTQIPLTKTTCVQSFSPAGNSVTMTAGSSRTFSVTFRDPAAMPTVTWFVNNVEQAQGVEFAFTPAEPGQYSVRATVNVNGGESNTWSVTAADRFFCGTGCSSNRDADHLILENTYAKIEFTQPVDLNAITALSQVISMTDSAVAVDTAQAPGLAGRTALVTIKKALTTPVILRSTGFNTGTFEVCAAQVCEVVSNQNGMIVFSVAGFSTYRVEEERAPAIQISPILFDNVDRGNTSIINVVIKNVGSSRPLTNLQAELVSVAGSYNARIIGAVPAVLGPQGEATIQLQVTIPSSEDAGIHSIGNLRVSSTEDTKTSVIQINPKSFLTISKVEVNGKETGDFTLEEENEITVKVKNEYTKDLENVQVTLRILNVDDDDIEEESSTFDLNKGDDEEIEFKIDLRSYELDQETYTLEIEVEGDGEDDTTHRTILRKDVKLELEKHNLVIQSAELGSSSLQCLPQTSLIVKIKNVGTEDEDDVEIRVKNEALGLDLSRKGIELDKFTNGDNDFETSFSINVEDTRAGSYPLTVEVLRDGDVEESKDVTLEVKDCSTASRSISTGQSSTAADSLRTYLQQQLQQRTSGTGQAAPAAQPEVRASFRETNAYLALVGTLVVLIFIATVLALAIMVVKKK